MTLQTWLALCGYVLMFYAMAMSIRGWATRQLRVTGAAIFTAVAAIVVTIVQVATHWQPWTWSGPVMPSALAAPVSLAVLVAVCWVDWALTKRERAGIAVYLARSAESDDADWS